MVCIEAPKKCIVRINSVKAIHTDSGNVVSIDASSNVKWPILAMYDNKVCVVGEVSGKTNIKFNIGNSSSICIFAKHPKDSIIHNNIGYCTAYNNVKMYYTKEWINKKEWTFWINP